VVVVVVVVVVRGRGLHMSLRHVVTRESL